MLFKVVVILVFTVGWDLLAIIFASSLTWLTFTRKGIEFANEHFGLLWRPLTILVGTFEVIATSLVVNFYLSQKDITQRQQITSIAALIGGWFAIKAFSHPLDSESVLQTKRGEEKLTSIELHYKFILGTIFSLGGGIILGLIILGKTF